MELEGMLKDQLKEEAAKRQLPVSGTNEELIERIRQYDLDHEDDPLGDDNESRPEDRVVAAGPDKPRMSTFVTLFPCPGELSTGVHQEYCERTIARAQADGYATRGVACRIDFTVKEGKRYAVYEVNLARENAARRY